jgi:hypothetical protein
MIDRGLDDPVPVTLQAQLSGQWQMHAPKGPGARPRPPCALVPQWLTEYRVEQYWRTQDEATIWRLIEDRLAARPFAFRPPVVPADPIGATFPYGAPVRVQPSGRIVPPAEVVAIRQAYATGTRSYRQLAAEHSVSYSTIAHLVRRETYRHVAAA